MPHGQTTRTHLRFDPPFLIGGAALVLSQLAVITQEERPYSPGIAACLVFAAFGVALAWPIRVTCHRAEHYAVRSAGGGR